MKFKTTYHTASDIVESLLNSSLGRFVFIVTPSINKTYCMKQLCRLKQTSSPVYLYTNTILIKISDVYFILGNLYPISFSPNTPLSKMGKIKINGR